MKFHLIKYILCLVGFFCLNCPIWSKIKAVEYNESVLENSPIYYRLVTKIQDVKINHIGGFRLALGAEEANLVKQLQSIDKDGKFIWNNDFLSTKSQIIVTVPSFHRNVPIAFFYRDIIGPKQTLDFSITKMVNPDDIYSDQIEQKCLITIESEKIDAEIVKNVNDQGVATAYTPGYKPAPVWFVTFTITEVGDCHAIDMGVNVW